MLNIYFKYYVIWPAGSIYLSTYPILSLSSSLNKLNISTLYSSILGESQAPLFSSNSIFILISFGLWLIIFGYCTTLCLEIILENFESANTVINAKLPKLSILFMQSSSFILIGCLGEMLYWYPKLKLKISKWFKIISQ